MKKVPFKATNKFCPQPLFLYGTYKEDGTPNFGLFCWFSYCFDKELQVMACIGESKLTKDRIFQTGVFSANLVTEPLLPLADYYGHKKGYDADKMTLCPKTIKGDALNVPILVDSPWSFELEVKQTIHLSDNSDIFLCKIANILADEYLADNNVDIETRFLKAAPVITTAATYFSVGKRIGSWGDWKEKGK